MEKFFGTYEIDLSKDENIDAFVAKLGLTPPVVQAIKTAGVTRTFGDNGDGKFFSEINHPLRKTRYNFKLKEQFDAEGFGGKQKITITVDGDTLTERVLDCAKNSDNVVKMKIEGSNLVVYMDGGGIVAKRTFVRK